MHVTAGFRLSSIAARQRCHVTVTDWCQRSNATSPFANLPLYTALTYYNHVRRHYRAAYDIREARVFTHRRQESSMT